MTEDAWIELLHERMPLLYRSISRRVGGDRALAEDVTQEAWLRAVEAWTRDGPPRDPGAWLAAVAANLLRNHFRRVRATSDEGLDGLTAHGCDSNEQRTHRTERAAALQHGLARLPPDSAALLCERHLDGDSLEDLARRRNLTARAIEGRLRRARAALARHVDADLLDGPT